MYFEATIIDINPSTDPDAYSTARKKYEGGGIIYFNTITKISGCKFKYLKVGDRILVRGVEVIKPKQKLNRKDLTFITHFEIINLQRKWDEILNNDPKLNGEAKVLTYGDKHQIIKPQVFDEESDYVVSNIETVKDAIVNYKFKNEQYEKIMLLYAEGKSLRYIGDLFGYHNTSILKIINKHLKEWGIK